MASLFPQSADWFPATSYIFGAGAPLICIYIYIFSFFIWKRNIFWLAAKNAFLPLKEQVSFQLKYKISGVQCESKIF
jgi:hypothetical protein